MRDTSNLIEEDLDEEVLDDSNETRDKLRKQRTGPNQPITNILQQQQTSQVTSLLKKTTQNSLNDRVSEDDEDGYSDDEDHIEDPDEF